MHLNIFIYIRVDTCKYTYIFICLYMHIYISWDFWRAAAHDRTNCGYDFSYLFFYVYT